MNSAERQSRDVEKSPRKSLSATSSPCSCRECKLKDSKKNSKSLKTITTVKPEDYDHGDWKYSKPKPRSPEPERSKEYSEPNFVKKSSSSTSDLKDCDCDEEKEKVKEEPLIEIFKAPQRATRVPSDTESIPVLRKDRQSSPTDHIGKHESISTYKSSSCWSLRDSEEDPSTSSLEIKSNENFIQESKANRGANSSILIKTPGRPPLPPQTKIKGRSSPSAPCNRQGTAVLSVGANTVGTKHLNNCRPPVPSFSSPSFISTRSLRTASSTSNFSLIPNTPPCTLAGTLPFSRELEFQRQGTSHSTLHGTESCTNLFAKTKLEHLSHSEPCIKCPLCVQVPDSGRSNASLHHRTMQSRYMTDLEWRICHAVNIYVYRNGEENQTPILVHIPPARKKNMKHVMATIQERMKYPIGYAKVLFKMDGQRIRHPCELEMYNNYVVGSNYDKYFKCVQYGRKRSPLLVLARESKHVRVLRMQNEAYDHWLMKKRAAGDERPQYIYPVMYTEEGYTPADLPVGQGGNYQPCGPFCKLPADRQCGASFNHENCGPPPNSEQSARHQGPPSHRQQQPEYTVNTMTVAAGPPRNPVQLLQQRRQNEMSMIEEEDEEEVMAMGTPRIAASTSKQRFQPIGKENESLFYGTKPRKRSRGVIDVSGEKKVFGSGSARLDYNANLLKNEYDEIPDFTDSNQVTYHVEQEIFEVVDETEDYCHDESQPSSQRQGQQPPSTRNMRPDERSQTCISATSRSYTILTKQQQPPVVQQGGTQTKMNLRPRPQPYALRKSPPPPDMPNTVAGPRMTGKAVSFYIPTVPSKTGIVSKTSIRSKLRKPPSRSSSQNLRVSRSKQNIQKQQQQYQQPKIEKFQSGESVSGMSNNNGFVAESTQSELSFERQNMQSQMGRSSWNSLHQMAQENQPSYQMNGRDMMTNSPRSPFAVDSGSQMQNNRQYYPVARDPNPSDDFACQYDEFSDALGESVAEEIDIPYTPHDGKSRNTYQPPPNFFPPFQDFRFLPNGALSNFNGSSGSTNKFVEPSFSKTQIDKPKCRNVATQFGNPCIERSSQSSAFKNPAPVGPPQQQQQQQQQVFQDSLQAQQLRLQNLLMQQQQLESEIQLAKQSSTQMAMAYAPQSQSQPQVYQVQSSRQEFQLTPRPQQLSQTSWGHPVQQSIQQNQMQAQLFIPPPSQFRDLGTRLNTRRNSNVVSSRVPVTTNVQNLQQRAINHQHGQSTFGLLS